MICTKINRFIETNKFPVLKRIDENYHNKINKEKKIMVIAGIDRKDNRHISFLNNIFHHIAIDNREDFVFTYLDYEEDKYFFRFFNINQSKIKTEDILFPTLLIYNFEINKYFVDYESLNEETNYLKTNDKSQIQNILDKINEGKIKWTSGFYLEDAITDWLGGNLRKEVLYVIYSGILFVIIIGSLFAFYLLLECKFKKGLVLKKKKIKSISNYDKKIN